MITQIYSPSPARYDSGMNYRRCGRSGVLLPEISLGLWHNFGDVDTLARSHEIITFAFDHGITHFDLANNYGPSYGSAEETFGMIMKKSLRPFRDELFISTKAGHDMWPGPYGEWGSRKHLFSSLDSSLRRMNLDYVDIFYSHRYDPATPLEETMQALVDIVRQGKALYVGISKYPADVALKAYAYLAERDVPCLLYQGKLNLLDQAPLNDGVIESAESCGVGFIAFSPLAQGLLTDRYLHGIPSDSRVARGGYLKEEDVNPLVMRKIEALNSLAAACGKSLASMALSWVLSQSNVASVIVGASSKEQLAGCFEALQAPRFSNEELQSISQTTGLKL